VSKMSEMYANHETIKRLMEDDMGEPDETAQELFDELCRPFACEEIDWRIGSTNADKSKGMALAYMDARAVMDRLDGVCGPDGWQCNYTPGVNGSIICNIGIRMPPAIGYGRQTGPAQPTLRARRVCFPMP
jgi:hypothetical protein